MRKIRETSEEGRDRSVITFESFHDLINQNREHDYRSAHMGDGGGKRFYGCDNMQEADKLARQGLPRSGVEAIKLASQNVALMAGELHRPMFDETYDVSGAVVDMGRYVEGEPECMVQYYPVEEPGQSKIVALILNVTYNCMISAEAIKKNGQAMMALVEAIETTGMQAEIWVDMYVSGGWDATKKYARTAVRLKKAGEPFDVSMFMYALTHNSFLRCHLFNAMHLHPADVRKTCGIYPEGGYGSPIHNAQDMEDFPPYSIYIPVISRDSEAGQFVKGVLKELNLIAA
ncbi:hypothetical protein SEA_CHASER_137 [Mycobacterium phage Chaser]|nr:hypothetical protein SEA_CHASER_137 [Mycobacterium phage Chaser]